MKSFKEHTKYQESPLTKQITEFHQQYPKTPRDITRLLTAWFNLSPKASHMLLHITTNHNTHTITLDKNNLPFKSPDTTYKALSELIHHNLIARSTQPMTFFIQDKLLTSNNTIQMIVTLKKDGQEKRNTVEK